MRKDDYFINYAGEWVDMKKSWSGRTHLRFGSTNQRYNIIKVYNSKVAQIGKGKSHKLGKNVIIDGQANEDHWGRKKETLGTK